jgi:Zn-dependent metalloprotease
MKQSQFVLIPVASLLITFLTVAEAEQLANTEMTLQSQQRLTDMRETLGLDEHHSFQAQSLRQDTLGQTHIRFQQFYNDLRVWGGEVITHTQADGRELPATTFALKQTIQVDTTPKLSVNDALAVAKKDLALSSDFSNKPTVELVVYPEKVSRVSTSKATVLADKLNAEDFVTEIKGYQLAYYLHTEVNKPNDTRHTDYLINAHTGAIIEKWDSLMTENAIGNGKSQYSGAVNLNTNSVSGGFELRDLTRPVSGGNVVYNLDHSTSGTGTIYKNANNTWGDGVNFKEDPEPTTSANGQTAAVDAAYGLQATWDMYKNVFGRNGINGEGKPTYARVHYDNAFDNAFYSDSCMCITYGDGTKLQTLTSLDVAAHEFSHGVCMTSADLIYNKESGGLNEANSDIMGAMAEFYMRGANGKGSVIPDTGGTWTQGEQITTPAFPLKMRFLYKPSKDGNSADAWSPTLEKLNVHYSSGPMNRAFYFLSQGATKTGETSTSYLPDGMTGIGNDKAAKIWFRALTTYMTPDTNYAGARIACIQAVRDLFPVSGAEEIAVWNAFAGINVGSVWSGADAPPTVTVSETGDKSTLTFSATASDDKGVTKVDFLLDSALVGSSASAPYTMTYDSLMQDDGSHTLVAKATDTTGQYTNATMTFTINNGQLIRNGSFEKGYGVGWSNTTGMQIGTILGQTAFDGTKMAKFCGTGSKMSVGLYQSVTIPASTSSATLSYALHIETKDTSTSVASDTLAVQIRNASGTILKTLATYSNLNAATGYKVYSLDMAAYKGQTVQLYFLGAEDGALSTGFILDKVNLTVSGSSNGDNPPNASASESGSRGVITLSATATDDVGITKVEFYVDDVLKGSDTSSPYSMTLDSTSLTDGTHSLVVKAYDTAGQIGTSTPVTFSINNANTTPVISVTEIGSSGTISFSATASDDVGVANVEFYVDNVLKGSDTTSPYSITLDSSTLSNGNHTLVGKAYDAAGNIGTSASVTFIVNNIEPPLTTYNEVENNGTTQTANVIADTVTKIVGYIGTSTDKDYFKINVPAGRTITVNMTGPMKDYDLYLLSSSGTTLKTSADAGSTESVSYKNASSTTATYYIKVVAFGGAYTLTTPYTLTLSR